MLLLDDALQSRLNVALRLLVRHCFVLLCLQLPVSCLLLDLFWSLVLLLVLLLFCRADAERLQLVVYFKIAWPLSLGSFKAVFSLARLLSRKGVRVVFKLDFLLLIGLPGHHGRLPLVLAA